MPDVTPVYGWPVPVLTDPPQIPSDITTLANAIETTIGAQQSPVGDSSNSITLTGGNIAFTANDNKNIVSKTITLTHDQWVILSGRALFSNASGSKALVGIYIDLGGGTPIPELTSGNVWVPATVDDRVQLVLPGFSVFLTAGSHTIRLRGDRDSVTATLNAYSDNGLNVASKPCFLGIIV